jgi:hypothetical protein
MLYASETPLAMRALIALRLIKANLRHARRWAPQGSRKDGTSRLCEKLENVGEQKFGPPGIGGSEPDADLGSRAVEQRPCIEGLDPVATLSPDKSHYKTRQPFVTPSYQRVVSADASMLARSVNRGILQAIDLKRER